MQQFLQEEHCRELLAVFSHPTGTRATRCAVLRHAVLQVGDKINYIKVVDGAQNLVNA